MEHAHTEEYKGMEIVIDYDRDAENPRGWDNVGTMVCFHSRYTLGDKHSYSSPEDALLSILEIDEDELPREYRCPDCEQTEQITSETETCSHCGEGLDDDFYSLDLMELSIDDLFTRLREKAYVLPLYLYDHSGITMNTGGFSCPWDSGQVGFIYAMKDYADSETPDPVKYLEGEVKTYDQYLTGDVYGYTVEDPEGYAEEDSCWGFYGLDYCLEEAKGAADWMVKERTEKKIEEQIEEDRKSLLQYRFAYYPTFATTA